MANISFFFPKAKQGGALGINGGLGNMSIIAGFINRAATLPKKFVEMEYINLPKELVNNIEFVGNIIFWIVVAAFGAWVIGKFLTNIATLHHQEV